MAHQPAEPASKATVEVTVPGTLAPKKKDKRYSKNAKGVQEFEEKASKSARRVSRAVEKGINTYLDERKKSADKRRDGALVESYVNVAKGVSESISDASPVLSDLADAINTKRTRKMLKKAVRTIPFVR